MHIHTIYNFASKDTNNNLNIQYFKKKNTKIVDFVRFIGKNAYFFTLGN